MYLTQFLNCIGYGDYNHSVNPYNQHHVDHPMYPTSDHMAYGGYSGRLIPPPSPLQNYHQSQNHIYPWHGVSVPQNSYQKDGHVTIDIENDCDEDCAENNLPLILPQITSQKRRRSYDIDNEDVIMEFCAKRSAMDQAQDNQDDIPMSVDTLQDEPQDAVLPTFKKKPRKRKRKLSVQSRALHNTRERNRKGTLKEAFATLRSVIPLTSHDSGTQIQTLKLSTM